MSRSQQQDVLNQATTNSTADQTAATNAQTAENADIGNYESQLSKYAASNPYTQGGEFDATTDKKLSGVADAGSAALTNQLQTQAQRTGENAGAANATAAEAARQNQRDLSTGEATADATRIGDEAGYNQSVVGASEVPAQLEQSQYATATGAANGALNTGESAAQTPSFWDTLGQGFASGLGQMGAAGIQAGAKACWIAAELYGGWFDPRTVDIRRWLYAEFSKTWYGSIIFSIYVACGERVAGWIKKWPILRRVFLPIFNKALSKARGV